MKNFLKKLSLTDKIFAVVELILFVLLIRQIILVFNYPGEIPVSNGLVLLIILNLMGLWFLFGTRLKTLFGNILSIFSSSKKKQVSAVKIDLNSSAAETNFNFNNEICYSHTTFVLYKQYDNIEIAKVDCVEPKFQIGKLYNLAGDPKNEYDSKAVKLTDIDHSGFDYFGTATCYGYLYKNQLQDMANDFIKRDDLVRAISLDKPLTKINLGFYKKKYDFKYMLENEPHITISIAKSKDEEIQDNLQYAELYQEIDIDYESVSDDADDYYYVSEPFEYGKIPHKYDELINTLSLEEPMCIESITEDANDNRKISIAIFNEKGNNQGE